METNKINFSVGFITLCQLFRKTYKSIKKNFNITQNEMRILIIVYHFEPDSIKKISERLALSPTLTSKTLATLEKKELIKRELNSQDKRFEKVILTEKGIRVTCLIAEFIEKFFSENVLKLMGQESDYLLKFSHHMKNKININEQIFNSN
ncbi:MAG: MarR family winged helix-turn-helix transcriptional regulator [Ignavibacterium sp.]